ncbi:hypothetical protein ACF07V_35645 [Streptomyces sp. NPDC015661]
MGTIVPLTKVSVNMSRVDRHEKTDQSGIKHAGRSCAGRATRARSPMAAI